MGLSEFHVVFIAVATLFCLGFSVWGVLDYRTTGNGTNLVLGLVALAWGVALLAYSRWFRAQSDELR
jgi:hypothetical protein